MEWKQTPEQVNYEAALAQMAARVEAIQQGTADELTWLLEHPPLYTAGTSAKSGDLLQHNGFPVYPTGRGGQYTYHGPGQRIAYVLRDLKKHAGPAGPDLRAYVKQLEHWIILTLAQFGIEGFIREGRVGVWVMVPEEARSADLASHEPATRRAGLGSMPMSGATKEAKIGALGVRAQKWVTSHGISLNVNPDLSHYAGIVPCGIREFGVTSMHALGIKATMQEVDAALKKNWAKIFD